LTLDVFCSILFVLRHLEPRRRRKHMATPVQVKETPAGLLVPRELYDRLGEIEIVEQPDAILIRSKAAKPPSLRVRAREALRQAGLVVDLDWEEPPPVSPEERSRLAQRLGQHGSLSELVIQERESGW
jgi:hypothetical protein